MIQQKFKTFVFLIAGMLAISCNQPTTERSEMERAPMSKENVGAGVQTAPAKHEVSPQSIPEIKSLHTKIMADLQQHNLDSVSIKYNCQGERSGTVTYFYEGEALRLIKHQYQEYDHFSATDEYFVAAQKLFFTYSDQMTWSFESEGVTKDDIVERRTYIADDKALECLEKKYAVRSAAAKNPTSATVPNKKVDCKPLTSILKSFERLVAFEKQKDHSCLGK